MSECRLPLDLPGYREEAQRLAVELHGVLWPEQDPGSHIPRQYVEAQLALLCDLTRPAGQEFAKRWLAKRLGWPSAFNAPAWSYVRADFCWALRLDGWCPVHFSSTPGKFQRRVPGISEITEPAEALRLACLSFLTPLEKL